MRKQVIIFSVLLGVLALQVPYTTVQALDEFGEKNTTIQQTVPETSQNNQSNNFYNSIPNDSSSTSTEATTEQYNEDEPLIKKRPVRDEDEFLDELRGAYNPITAEGLQEGKKITRQFERPISVGISILVWTTFLVTGLITAIDILYIKVPFVRKFLYTAGTDGTGGASGYNVTGGQSIGGIQWISDEAASVTSLLGGSAQANGHTGGVYGAGGAGTGAQPSGVQQRGGKSVLGVYIRRRVFTLALLGFTMPLIFTSLFIDLGMNVGSLVLDIFYTIQGFFS